MRTSPETLWLIIERLRSNSSRRGVRMTPFGVLPTSALPHRGIPRRTTGIRVAALVS